MQRIRLALVALGGLSLMVAAATAAPSTTSLHVAGLQPAVTRVDYDWHHHRWHHRRWAHHRWHYWD